MKMTNIPRLDPAAPQEPLVSVVIPAYNSGNHLRACIESVFSQDYRSFEIIVVDDGSTDNTPDILAEYADRIRAIKQENGGAATARNKGMMEAAGKYIAFLDSDDVWLPGKLRRQVEVLENDPAVGLVCSRWRCWYPDESGSYPPHQKEAAPRREEAAPGKSGWLYTDLLKGCIIWTSTVVIRREVVDAVGGFDPELRRGQDYDYWLRVSRVTQIKELEDELALYRMDDAATVRKAGGVNWELAVVSRAVKRWGTTGPDGRALPPSALRRRFWQLHFDFGYQQFHQGKFDLAAKAFASAVRYRPFYSKNYIYAFASTLGRFAC